MRRQGKSRTGTKSEITGRNRNQSTRALARTDPSATATPQNRLTPMNRTHSDNQPPPTHPPEAPIPGTKPENESLKPIWSTPVPAGRQPPTTRHTTKPRNSNGQPITQQSNTARPSARTTPNHGPNPRTGAENRSSPHEHRPTRRHQPAATPKPQNPNNPPAGPAPISAHRPPRGPITRTESGIILRNRSQSSQAPADTRPSISAIPENR